MAEDEVKRKLTTILAADVAGYTRLMRADEEATFKTLGVYRDVIDGLIARYNELGRDAEARAEAEKYLGHDPFFSLKEHAEWRAGFAYKGQSWQDRYIEALRQAGLPE